MIALYLFVAGTRGDRWAFLGMVLMLIGIGPFQTFDGIAAFAYPATSQQYLSGNKGALGVVVTLLAGAAIPVVLIGLGLMALGAMLFAVAIWQTNALPKAAAALLALGLVFFIPAPELPRVVRIVDGALIGVGGLWLAWAMLQSPGAKPLCKVPQ